MSVSLSQPSDGAVGWNPGINSNFNTIQTLLNDGVTSNATLGSNTTISSTTPTDVKTISFTPAANEVALIFANLVFSGLSGSALAHYELTDEGGSVLAAGWKLIPTSFADHTTLVAAQSISAGVTKTWHLKMWVDASGQSFQIDATVGPTFIGYAGAI